jgi:hypothetical protein
MDCFIFPLNSGSRSLENTRLFSTIDGPSFWKGGFKLSMSHATQRDDAGYVRYFLPKITFERMIFSANVIFGAPGAFGGAANSVDLCHLFTTILDMKFSGHSPESP